GIANSSSSAGLWLHPGPSGWGKSLHRSKSSPAVGPRHAGNFPHPGILRWVHSSVEQTPSDGTDVLVAQGHKPKRTEAPELDILDSFGAIFTRTNRSRLLRNCVPACVREIVLFLTLLRLFV
ncbi:hypothetical protein M5D96_002225, partial [Drosophila gunungcola]